MTKAKKAKQKFDCIKKKVFSVLIAVVEFITFPHVIIALILIIMAIIAILLSYHYKDQYPFVSSLLSNIFAGLATGVAISIIAGVKSTFNNIIESKISFLKEIQNDCMLFFDAYYEMFSIQESDGNIYNSIHDTLFKGQIINTKIVESQFCRTISFNPYRYFCNKIQYEADFYTKKYNELAVEINNTDINNYSAKDLVDLFKDMCADISKLNAKVLISINGLETRKKISQKFII